MKQGTGELPVFEAKVNQCFEKTNQANIGLLLIRSIQMPQRILDVPQLISTPGVADGSAKNLIIPNHFDDFFPGFDKNNRTTIP